ncbi:MAG: nucleotide exchange factor GrpE [Candidatus Marinimicrobia bacterium]|nr:nucleotide exchange factor GrpE [Candidatus Neomarinimicrobiota bacterium]
MPFKEKTANAEQKKKPVKKSPTAKLKDKIKALESDLETKGDKHLRLKAEFDNYRRRKEKDTINMLKYDGESVIKQFLSVLDDLDRLAKAAEENGTANTEKIKEGIDLILNKIKKRFAELEVRPFTEEGDIADPELHDALMMRFEEGKNENEILEVFEKGYRYKDRVIRHAKVVVNQTPS